MRLHQSEPSLMRLIVAFVSAAAIAALVPFLTACAAGLIFKTSCDVDFGWSRFAIIVTLAATVFIAAPLFVLFSRLNWLQWWQVAVGGAIVGLLLPIFLQILDSGSTWVWYRFAIVSMPLGFFSGLVFWLVGYSRIFRF